MHTHPHIAALALLPVDARADILLRAVEEGSTTAERAIADAAQVGGNTLYALRMRLNALDAFTAFSSQRAMVEASLRTRPERTRAPAPLEVSW